MEAKNSDIKEAKLLSVKEEFGNQLTNKKEDMINGKELETFKINKRLLSKKRNNLKDKESEQWTKASNFSNENKENSEKGNYESFEDEEEEEIKDEYYDEETIPHNIEIGDKENEEHEEKNLNGKSALNNITRPRAKNYVTTFETPIYNKKTYSDQLYERLEEKNHLYFVGIFDINGNTVCFVRFGQPYNYNENKSKIKAFDYKLSNNKIISPKVTRGFKNIELYEHIVKCQNKYLSKELKEYFINYLSPRFKMKYLKGIDKFKQAKKSPKKWQVNKNLNNNNNGNIKKENERDYIWIQGPKGVGKYYVARESCNDKYYFNILSKNWKDYENQETVISILFYITKPEQFGYLEQWVDKGFNPGKNNGNDKGNGFKRLIVVSKKTINEICCDNIETCKKLKNIFKIIDYKDRILHDRILDWLKNPSKIPSLEQQRQDYINLKCEDSE